MDVNAITLPNRLLIDGAWREAADHGTFAVTNPATNEMLAEVPCAGATEARDAITAAAGALPSWREMPGIERGRLLARLAVRMKEEQERLARILTSEQGKPLAEARGEILYAASFLEWYAAEAQRVYGETIPAPLPGKRLLALRRPVGVCAAITPWNFPSAMITRKIAPALAAGCTVIVKPAEETPLSALALGELMNAVGFPGGVVNIIAGRAAAIGEVLCADPRVRKLSFTGSTETGRILMRQSAENLQRLSLELGGHAPFIVFEDANIEQAVSHAMITKFRNAGQTCICANRFYVHARIHEAFVERLEAAMRALRVDHGLAEHVHIGPLINDAAVEKVERHVQDALERGARLRCGGTRVTVPGCADRFYAPTLLDGLAPDMLCAREETFGPVAPVASFTSDDEAIERANDSPYGLAAYVMTTSASRAWKVAEALEFGVIGLNDGAPSTAAAPFGGVKHSGFGREGGHHGMEEYLTTRYVSWGV